MDSIVVEGVRYEKALLLAKEFKYTSDYIGQLCRGNKVDAQLVGRTWYVNRDSLEKHRNSRYSKFQNNTDEKSFEYKVKINKSRIDVEPFFSKKTARSLELKNNNFSKRIDWKPVKYEYDHSNLIPDLADQKKKLPINLADANKLKVAGVENSTKLVSEGLPTISLSGDIKIQSLEEKFIVDDEILDKKIEINDIGEDNLLSRDYLSDNHKNENTTDNIFGNVQEEDLDQNFRFKKAISVSLLVFLSLVLILVLFVDLNIFASKNSYETNFSFSYDLFNLVKDKF